MSGTLHSFAIDASLKLDERQKHDSTGSGVAFQPACLPTVKMRFSAPMFSFYLLPFFADNLSTVDPTENNRNVYRSLGEELGKI